MLRAHRLPLILVAIAVAIGAVAPVGAAATPAPRAPLSLVLPLAGDVAGLQAYAAAVSTPTGPLYRHYRPIAWLAAHFGASRATQMRVVSFLRAHGAGAVRVDRTGFFIDAELTRSQAETVFSTRAPRRRSRAQAVGVPAAAATVPPALRGSVTGVIGLDTSPVLAAPALARATPQARGAFASLSGPLIQGAYDTGSGYGRATGSMSGCQAARAVGGFTPGQYLSAYGYGPLHRANILGQGERVALIEVDGFLGSDISAFARCFGLHLPRILAFATDRSVSRIGLAPGGEATLDLEVLATAAPRLSQIDVYESSADIASALRALTAPLQNSGRKPQVISASLGLCEPQVRQAIGLGGLRSTEAALAEAAASGISVLAASGDDGSADCVDSTSAQGLPLPQLAVNFPASSPDVTAVGGTNLILNPANQIVAQRVWNDDQASPGSAGGGGLSSVFGRPAYQNGLVATNQRALPDVSMLADIGPGFDVYCTARPQCVSSVPGQSSPWQSVGGTSAATPLLAGGLALVDELLRTHKQQGLGLVNPLLYALGSDPSTSARVFSDVVAGSNDVGPFIRASRQPLGCCSAGRGFDAASGWGSVNLAGLASAALAIEPALVDVTQALVADQRPLGRGAILDLVSCSGPCVIGALAHISVTGERAVTVRSGLYHLTAAGSRIVVIGLSGRERASLRTALARHRRIRASVVGAIVDPAGNVERQTPASSLSLTR